MKTQRLILGNCVTRLAQNAVRRVQLLGARDGKASSDHFIVRRALAKLARNLLANSFVAWYGVGSLRRGAEEEEARRWRENILKCERYVHRMSRRTLSRAFTRWETERSRMKTQRQMLRNCVARLSLNHPGRVQLVVVDHHRATAPSRVGEARGREDLARRYVVDVFAWQRHIRAKAVWEAKVGLSRRFLASISHQALYRAFHRWREAARKLRALDRKVARCVHRMTRNAVANAFIEWAELVDHVTEKRRRDRYVHRMSRRTLSRAFTLGSSAALLFVFPSTRHRGVPGVAAFMRS